MHRLWVVLVQLLVEGAGMALSQAMHGPDAYAPEELDALGLELRQLDILLAEHGLRLEVLDPALESLRLTLAETLEKAPELVMYHIREPLSRLIAKDFFSQGDTVVVDFIDGTYTIGRTA